MKKKKKFIIGVLSVFSAALCFAGIGKIFLPANASESGNANNKKSDIFECFSMAQVIDNYEIPAYAAHSSSVGTGTSNTGIAMLTSSGNAGFTYKNPIRVEGLTEETNLIEMFALAGGDYTGVNTIKITLTDTENAANTFSVRYYVHSAQSERYCFLDYQGRTIAWSSETANYLWTSGYGAWTPGVSFTGKEGNDTVTPFSVWMNYEERKVYCTYGSRRHMLMDLDDVAGVGKGGIWNGFESGMAELSVSFELNQAKLGGVFVKSILGYNLDGGFENEDSYDAPSITYLMPNEYLEKMPDGGIGVPYALPEIYATDWYFGKCDEKDVSVKVTDKAGNDVTSQVKDNNFTATQAGIYTIRYTAKNPQKSNSDELTIKIIDNLPPIVISALTDYSSSEILTQTDIPTVDVYGGSGIVEVKETLYYNGQEVELNSARTLYLDKAGTVSLKVEAKGYTGPVAVKYFTLVINEATVLSVQNMPMILQSNTEIIFPKAVAYNSATKQDVTAEIYVDGQKLSDDRKYQVEKTSGSITVTYTAKTDAYGEKVKTFEIPVVNSMTLMPSDLMLVKEGDVLVEDSFTAINLTSTKSFSEVNWAYPVVTGSGTVNSVISISGLTENNQIKNNSYDYIDIVYANFANITEKMFIRIYRQCEAGENICYMQINGIGAKYLIDGNLGVPNLPINIYVDTQKGYVYDAVKYTPICSFEGYKAEVSVVGFRFGNVDGTASVSLIQLSNQRMSSTSDWYDNNMPVVSFADEMKVNSEIKRGEYIKIPATQAYDMLSHNATVLLKVTAPGGEVILETSDLSAGVSILAEKSGYYRLQFISEDYLGNKDTTAIYNCYVYDDTAPTLVINGSIKEQIKIGATATIPTATATDNLNEECNVFVYMRVKGDYSTHLVEMGSKLTFNKAGTYELVYVTRDSDYNYTKYVMTITVKE